MIGTLRFCPVQMDFFYDCFRWTGLQIAQKLQDALFCTLGDHLYRLVVGQVSDVTIDPQLSGIPAGEVAKADALYMA